MDFMFTHYWQTISYCHAGPIICSINSQWGALYCKQQAPASSMEYKSMFPSKHIIYANTLDKNDMGMRALFSTAVCSLLIVYYCMKCFTEKASRLLIKTQKQWRLFTMKKKYYTVLTLCQGCWRWNTTYLSNIWELMNNS